MGYVKIYQDWLSRILPDGLPYPSSTLISGPGGTGKPLVEFAFVASWLKNGGSAVGIPLQYPTMDFVHESMKSLYGMDLNDYSGRISFIQFDPHVESYEEVGDGVVRANLLKPDVWDDAIIMAEEKLEKSNIGTLVFGSALNLLLFSPTYKDAILKKLKEIIESYKERTYIFSVSTSAFANDIKAWEDSADNLMFTRMEPPMTLFFRVEKMKEGNFSKDEIKVPIDKDVLLKIKEVAESTRKRIIPELMKI